MWSQSFVIKSNFLAAYHWTLGFKRIILWLNWVLGEKRQKETYTLFPSWLIKAITASVFRRGWRQTRRRLTDSENSHIISLLSPHILQQMRHYTLTKAIGLGPRRWGCSRLVIVHHHCLHGSDALRSIAPFEQTSGGKEWKAGGGVGYCWRTERGMALKMRRRATDADWIMGNRWMTPRPLQPVL